MNCTNPDIESVDTFDSTEKSGVKVFSKDLSEDEIAGILYMREEEKLARDVYIELGLKFDHNTFANIQLSEEIHTNKILDLINFYDLIDPAFEKEYGEFDNHHLQDLYWDLIDLGKKDLGSALSVGATIEDIDIAHLDGYIADTEVKNIVQVYGNLVDASENHLRVFVSALSRLEIEFTPTYLSQERFNDIINDTE